MKGRTTALLTTSSAASPMTMKTRSAASLFLHHQRRTYAARANVQRLGDFKKNMLGHHTVNITRPGGATTLMVLPSRGLSPFSSASVILVHQATTASEGQGESWSLEEKRVGGPFPRMHARGHVFGDELVVSGTHLRRKGLVSMKINSETLSKDGALVATEIAMIDPASQKSTKRFNLMSYTSEATHNPSKVWLFGENYFNSKNDNLACEVTSWDKTTNTMYSGTANTLPMVGEGPTEKKELAVAAVGKDKIYVVSPDINKTKLVTYVLDTERLEWSFVKTKGDKPVNPRAGYSLTAAGDKLVFLGYDMSLSGAQMEIYILDTDTSTWEKAEMTGDVIPSRFGHTTTHLGNNEFVTLGGKGPGYFYSSVDDYYKFKLDF